MSTQRPNPRRFPITEAEVAHLMAVGYDVPLTLNRGSYPAYLYVDLAITEEKNLCLELLNYRAAQRSA